MIAKELLDIIFLYDFTYRSKYNCVIKEMKKFHNLFKDFNYDFEYHYFDYNVYFDVYLK